MSSALVSVMSCADWIVNPVPDELFCSMPFLSQVVEKLPTKGRDEPICICALVGSVCRFICEVVSSVPASLEFKNSWDVNPLSIVLNRAPIVSVVEVLVYACVMLFSVGLQTVLMDPVVGVAELFSAVDRVNLEF